MGSFRAGKSKYYSDKVFDPVSQSHYNADTGQAEQELQDIDIITEDTNDIKQLAVYASVFAVMLFGVWLAGQIVPKTYLITMGLATFAAGMLLPALRVAPFMADDSDDLAIALALMLICGPFVGAMFYGVLWVIRGEANPAVVGIFLSYILIRVTLDASTGHAVIDLFSKMLPDMNVARWADFAARLMPLVGLLGWLCADPLKKPDE